MDTTTFVVTLICQLCGENFAYDIRTFATLKLDSMPKKCPKCKDQEQGRPDAATVTSRIPLFEFPAVRNFLPSTWFQPYQATQGDKQILRATVTGRSMGSHWVGKSYHGRIDIYCLAETLPEMVRVRIMEVTHLAGQVHREKSGNWRDGVSYSDVTYSPTYQYMVLEPAADEPTAALITTSVNRKTTLKGFGLQWSCSLDASNALWAIYLSNSCRSGRYGNSGCIAIIDDDHQVIGSETGKYGGTWHYSLSHPQGQKEEPPKTE